MLEGERMVDTLNGLKDRQSSISDILLLILECLIDVLKPLKINIICYSPGARRPYAHTHNIKISLYFTKQLAIFLKTFIGFTIAYI